MSHDLWRSMDFVCGLAVIEKYTRNTRFCLICNYVGKIIPALQSRCTRFRFPPLAESYVRMRLQHVIDSERRAPALMDLLCCRSCTAQRLYYSCRAPPCSADVCSN